MDKSDLNSESQKLCNSHVTALRYGTLQKESVDELTSRETYSCSSDVKSSQFAPNNKESSSPVKWRANPIDILCIPCRRSRRRKEREEWFNTTLPVPEPIRAKIESSVQTSAVDPEAISRAVNAETNGLVDQSGFLTCKRQTSVAEENEISRPASQTISLGDGKVTADTVWTAANKVLLSRLECPVCFQFMTPPLRQCRSGHSICSSCYDRLNRCPTCRRSFIETSNVILNELCLIIVLPCRYYLAGCNQLLRLSEKAQHEEKCEWMQYSCPHKTKDDSCSWEGKQSEVISHVLEKHNDILARVQLGLHVVLRYTYGRVRPVEETSSETDKCNVVSRILVLVNADGQEEGVFVFSVRYDLTDGSLCGVLRYIGSKQEASKYNYKIKLSSPDDIFSVSSTTSVASYIEDLDYIVGSGAVLSFDGRTFKKFVNDKGKFFVSVKVTLHNIDVGQEDS